MDFLRDALNELAASGLLREMRCVSGAQGPTVCVGGREVVCLCSNNYLSLASRPELARAAADAALAAGCGSGASRLISGNMDLHEELEAEIARIKRREAAILFPTGYMANAGTIPALAGTGDAVIVDKLDHASIIDGCRLSGAKLLVYEHCNPERLEHVLQRADARRKLVITDSVFSMDGDIAPLPALLDVCRRHGAMLMIDEAHATGVLGAGARGTEDHFGMTAGADVVMGTLSKAAGSLGGFVAGSRELISYLRNTARSFIYTTALPPPVCAASLAGLRLIETDPRPRERLNRNVKLLNDLLLEAGIEAPQPHPTPIFPIRVGGVERAVAISIALFEQGFLCPAIRPPTVPAGTSRIRVSLQAGHSEEQIRSFAAALRDSRAVFN